MAFPVTCCIATWNGIRQKHLAGFQVSLVFVDQLGGWIFLFCSVFSSEGNNRRIALEGMSRQERWIARKTSRHSADCYVFYQPHTLISTETGEHFTSFKYFIYSAIFNPVFSAHLAP